MDKQTHNRFSKTIEFYHRYRPGYPQALLELMRAEMAFTTAAIVADIGAGTGKLTELFLEHGNPVFAVEPNDAMRGYAEKLLGRRANFMNRKGDAARTGLAAESVDVVTVAQAFHWFEPSATRAEFQRILKPGGWVLLIWNKRIDERSAFMQAYNQFLETHSTDYQDINLRKIDQPAIDAFFEGKPARYNSFEHAQQFDLDGLIGRYRSCSYAYTPSHPDYGVAIETLEKLFERHQENGQLDMYYRTEVYYSQWD